LPSEPVNSNSSCSPTGPTVGGLGGRLSSSWHTAMIVLPADLHRKGLGRDRWLRGSGRRVREAVAGGLARSRTAGDGAGRARSGGGDGGCTERRSSGVQRRAYGSWNTICMRRPAALAREHLGGVQGWPGIDLTRAGRAGVQDRLRHSLDSSDSRDSFGICCAGAGLSHRSQRFPELSPIPELTQGPADSYENGDSSEDRCHLGPKVSISQRFSEQSRKSELSEPDEPSRTRPRALDAPATWKTIVLVN
jgi:hypothetical protein